MKRVIFIVMILNIIFASLTPSFALTLDQTPIVQNVYITPSKIFAGSVVTVKAEVNRQGLNVTSLTFIFASQSKGYKKIVNLEYDKLNYVFIGSFSINDSDETGDWHLDTALFHYLTDGSSLQGILWSRPFEYSALNEQLRARFHPDPQSLGFHISDGKWEDMELYISESDGKKGYINEKGETIISPQYLGASDFINGRALVEVSSKKWGYIDKFGQEVIKPQFDLAGDFSGDYAVVRSNGKFGYISISGKVVIDCKYDYAGPFSEGIACVKTMGRYGFINSRSKFVIPSIYDNAKDLSEGLIAVRLNGKWGYVDKNGKSIIKPVYNDALNYSGNMAAVCINGKWGYVNKNGKLIVPAIYNTASNYHEGLAAVSQYKKMGYINEVGEVVIPLQYEVPNPIDLSDFHSGFAAVKTSGKWGFIDETSQFKVDPQYDSLQKPFNRGMAMVSIGDKSCYINTKGQLIWARYIKQ